MLELIDKSFCHAIVIGKRTGCLESGQLFLYAQGKGFQFRNATRGADTDPGGGSLALLVFEEMKKLLRHTIGQLKLLFLLDEGERLLVFGLQMSRILHKQIGKLSCGGKRFCQLYSGVQLLLGTGRWCREQ